MTAGTKRRAGLGPSGYSLFWTLGETSEVLLEIRAIWKPDVSRWISCSELGMSMRPYRS